MAAGAETENGSFDSPCEPPRGSARAPADVVLREGEHNKFDIVEKHPKVETHDIMNFCIDGQESGMVFEVFKQLETLNESKQDHEDIRNAGVDLSIHGETFHKTLMNHGSEPIDPANLAIIANEAIKAAALAIQFLQYMVNHDLLKFTKVEQ